METSASFEARSAPSPYPTIGDKVLFFVFWAIGGIKKGSGAFPRCYAKARRSER
jgi:hypothetical protein